MNLHKKILGKRRKNIYSEGFFDGKTSVIKDRFYQYKDETIIVTYTKQYNIYYNSTDIIHKNIYDGLNNILI